MTHWQKRLHEVKTLTRLDFTQFAAAVGLSRETVRKPTNDPTVSVALQVALSVGLEVDQLLTSRRITALGVGRETKEVKAGQGPAPRGVPKGWALDGVTLTISRFEADLVRVPRGTTRWAECMDVLRDVAGSMSAAAAAVDVPAEHYRAWVRAKNRCEPRSQVAISVSKMCGLSLHEMLTAGISDPQAVALRLGIGRG